jgi:hypothetical protein
MLRGVAFIPMVLAVLLSGCGEHAFERREPWRDTEAAACMAQHPFRGDQYISPARNVNDAGPCGMRRPLDVTALNDGTVGVSPTAMIGCPMAVALEAWLTNAVQPAAIARLGSQVVGIRQLSDYSCRNVNGATSGNLSEHAFGNAIDIAAFILADGREITVLHGWNGTQAERDFLREAHATACQYFKTVLGPGVDLHDNHFHLDLAHHNADGTSHYCRPTPVMPDPVAQPIATPAGDIGGLLQRLFNRDR